LTTFSTFSSEVVANILAGDHLMGALHIVAHLGGSLFLTMLGLWTVRTFS
ncbi:fluoride ion transporter CrcB, partial [Rhizobium leguminosarum]|nr:fluoride ion transporter CrcB [Rhizobium ruizarguesonis]